MQPSPLTRVMDQLEIGSGANLYVHSSFRFCKVLALSGEQILDQLLARVGPRGTVAMPSYWWHWQPDVRLWATYRELFHAQPKPVFDIRRDGCNIGHLPALFCARPGVQRALAYVFTISALGPLAGDLCRPQAEDTDDFDPAGDSTLARLIRNRFTIVGLGVTNNTTSFGVVPDRVLRERHTQAVFSEPLLAPMRDADGREHLARSPWILPDVVTRTRPGEVIERSGRLDGRYREVKLENSLFFSYAVQDFLEQAVSMGREALARGEGVPWLPEVPLRGESLRVSITD